MANYTRMEMQEALISIDSMLGKIEKVLPKLKPGTAQWTQTDNRIKALRLASTLLTELLVEKTDIFEVFRAEANPENAASMSAYMRDQFPFLGIKTPERKKLSSAYFKVLFKTSGREKADWVFVESCWEQPEREFQYLAVDYLSRVQKILGVADIPKLKRLITTKSWWDTVDGLDRIVGDIALVYPEVNEVLLAWSEDDDFWLRRVAIDHQLQRKERTDTELLARIVVNNLGQTEFFINKAIGWALREYSKTDSAWVRGFIEQYGDRMAPLSIREAGKYL